MKVVVVYRPASEHGRSVEEFLHEFQRLHPSVKVETKDLETEEGARAAELYDIVAPPAILALRDDGSVLQLWSGENLPLMNEVAAYA